MTASDQNAGADDGAEEARAQGAVVAHLTASAAPPGRAVVTHISRIFLIADRALKLKRARRLPFVDFSSLEARAAACRREIELNQPGAPDIYLGAAPVFLTAEGEVVVGAPGAPATPPAGARLADWLVVMRRFAPEDELHARVAAGAADADEIRRLADRLAELQAAAPPRPEARQPAQLEEVVASVARACGAGDAAPAAARWAAAARRAAAALGPLLAARRAAGAVRRLHGDMHLGNVVVLEGRPTPFDAIEFSEAIAEIDVLYDAAFPAMDLLDHGRPDLANAFFSRYLAATGDHDGLAAWPLFLSLRAGVRAMTAALEPDPAVAARRLALAQTLLETPAPPRLVAVGGLSGAGKTRLARRLAPRLPGPTGALILSSDEIRKRMRALPPEARAPAAAYAPAVSAEVYARMEADAAAALAAGTSVLLDATFTRADGRDRLAPLAARAGARFDGLWLSLAEPERLARVAARSAAAARDPAAAAGSDAGREVARRQRLERPDALGAGWREIPAERAEAEAEAALSLPPRPAPQT